jgi:hypothetical protein
MKSLSKFVVVVMGLATFTTFIGLMASADGLHTYKIDAMKQKNQGVEAPLRDKSITLTVNYRGKHGSIERVIGAKTDSQGAATVTFDQDAEDQEYMTFDGVTQFCGKFDGPNYCATLSTDLATELNGEKVELTDDSKKPKYNCELEHNPGFLTDTSTIHVLCKAAK